MIFLNRAIKTKQMFVKSTVQTRKELSQTLQKETRIEFFIVITEKMILIFLSNILKIIYNLFVYVLKGYMYLMERYL